MVEELIISLRGHCQKSGDELTPKGIEDAKNIGRSIEIPPLGIVAYHSHAARTRQTAEYIFEGAGLETRVFPAEFDGVNLLDTIVPHMNNDWPSSLSAQDAVIYCLDNEREAMKIVGDNLAKFTELMVKKYMGADIKNKGLRVEAISHRPNLEAYLMQVLGEIGIGLLRDGLYFQGGKNLIYHPERKMIEIPHIQSEYPIK